VEIVLDGPAEFRPIEYSMEKLPPPGFYPDSTDPSVERWWNGQGWSEETRPLARPVSETEQVPQPAVPAEPESSEKQNMEWDTTLLPKSGFLRFLALRPKWQIYLAIWSVPVIGTILGVLLVKQNLISISWIAVAPLLAYPILFHDGLRRRYGFRGQEPGRNSATRS